jgi:hypothetical protein
MLWRSMRLWRFLALAIAGLLIVEIGEGSRARAQQPAPSPAIEENPPSESAPADQPPDTTRGVPAATAAENATDFDPRDQIRRSSGLYGDITHVGLRRFLVLMTAFVIGTAGAAAFHLGVYAGFIARESRPGVLEFLHTEFLNRTTITQQEMSLARTLRIAFWCFGGVVAVVFQMADADSLVPIQAFVLGASWPTVVTQLMSGRSAPPPPQRASIIPETPPGPSGGGTVPEGAGGGGRSVEVIS